MKLLSNRCYCWLSDAVRKPTTLLSRCCCFLCWFVLSCYWSPEVRGGAGELHIRSITAFIDVLEGNTSSSYDHLVRGAEVMIANPGMCRLSAWWVGYRVIIWCPSFANFMNYNQPPFLFLSFANFMNYSQLSSSVPFLRNVFYFNHPRFFEVGTKGLQQNANYVVAHCSTDEIS